jgi:hypothetical protein
LAAASFACSTFFAVDSFTVSGEIGAGPGADLGGSVGTPDDGGDCGIAGAVDGATGGAADCGAVEVDIPDGSTLGDSGLFSPHAPTASATRITVRRFFIVPFRFKGRGP